MIGLELITMLKGISYGDIAKDIGVTKQAVSLWVRKERVPEDKVEILSKMLGYPGAYITSKVDIDSLENDIHKYLKP